MADFKIVSKFKPAGDQQQAIDGLVDGLDVDTVGYQSLEGALAGIKATGGTYTFESQSGVVIRATSPTAMVDGDDLVGYLLYVVD